MRAGLWCTLLSALALAPAATADAAPRCFGAASRDPEVPCVNPALRLSVTPTPAQALRAPNAPCRVVGRRPFARCVFGVPARAATGTVALIGDSHAGHWRAGLDAVAQARGWHGISVTHSGCPLASASRRLPEPKGASCRRWNAWVPRWLADHPEVRTVVVAASTGGSFKTPAGADPWARAVSAYARAWRALPASVDRIVGLRDPPWSTHATAACVSRVHARRRAPGTACARARRAALRRDPLATAAARSRSRRVALVDLSPVFCDARRCYPVIGGVLVNKDVGHLTAAFSGTLGPLLGRALDRLEPGR